MTNQTFENYDSRLRKPGAAGSEKRKLSFSRRGFMALLAASVSLGVFWSIALPGSAKAQDVARTLLVNVNIFNGKDPELKKGMSVLVEDGVISKIMDGKAKAPEGALVIDGGGRTLMPGLIDNHVHIFMGANTMAQMVDTKAPFEELEARGAEEARKMVLRGFTSGRDMGGPIFGIKAAIDSGKAVGPRLYPSGATVSQTSGHGDARLRNERAHRFGGEHSRGVMIGATFLADGRDEVLTATRENLRFGATQIKVMAGGGAATLYDPLDTTQYTLDELKAAVEAADDWNTYVTVHAYTVKSVRRAVEAGVKCIEHGQLLDEATIKLLAKKDVWLSLQALDPAPPQALKAVREKKQQVIDGTDAAFKWAKKYKVKLAWGTDFLFDPRMNENQNKDILKLKQWFSPFEALRLVTSENGKLLKLSGLRDPYPGALGVVEEGALADMLLVDGNPLADLDVIADPEKNFKVIMMNGKIVKNTL